MRLMPVRCAGPSRPAVTVIAMTPAPSVRDEPQFAGHLIWPVVGAWLPCVQADGAAGQRRAHAPGLAGEGGGAVLAADPGAQDGERDHEDDDDDEG